MPYEFTITDLSGGDQAEVTNADVRKVVRSHLRVGSAGFTIPIYDSLATRLVTLDNMLKVYRTDPITLTKLLVFYGPIVSAEESADGTQNTIAVTAADPMWRLTKRLIPGSLSKTGIMFGDPNALVDLGLIAHNILSDVNGVNFTGLSVGSRTASINGFYKSPPLKVASEAIAELHAGLNSFEYKVVPTEPTNVAGTGGWPQVGTFNIAPLIGVARPDAVFEYGTTRANVATYTRQVSRDGQMNKGVIGLSGWPDGTTKDLITRTDPTSITNRGLFEDVVPDGGITDDTLRTSVADYHVAIRKDPRTIITFRPVVNAQPAPFVDYDVGDTVQARAIVSGTLRFDVNVRIWGVSIDIDKNGNESVELEMVMP